MGGPGSGRGGPRPGSGPKKGTKYNKRKLVEIDSTNVIGPKEETKSDIEDLAALANMTPLEYMLKVMRDPFEDKARRDRMASWAAPYMHVRKGEGGGKKSEKEEKAKEAGRGRFAPSAPPSLKVVGK